MNTKPTQDQIDRAIEKLHSLRKSMPHHNVFGDDNWKEFDLQTEVLNGDITESKIYQYGDAMASRLLDVIEWKKGLASDWFDDLMAEEISTNDDEF